MFNKLFNKNKGMVTNGEPQPTKKMFTMNEELFERAMGYVDYHEKLQSKFQEVKEHYVKTGRVLISGDEDRYVGGTFSFVEQEFKERMNMNNDLVESISRKILQEMGVTFEDVMIYQNDLLVASALWKQQREVELVVSGVANA